MSIGEAMQSSVLDQLDEMQQSIGEGQSITQELSDPRNTMTHQQRVKMFARLENLRRDLEEALKLCKSQTEKLGGELLEDMAESGTTSINADGLNIHQKKIFYVSKRADKDGATNEAVCEALKSSGMDFLVKNADSYSAASLKAHIKELMNEGKEVPSQVAGLLNIGEKVTLTSTKRG
ncbi:hypothetical protein Pan241w_11670 [Gimesia alba]|uniref:Uncharacterized protein n=1 Tax=Gimesia alba TaxID=2527973 RepID=A0A517RB56_9PLAN|nr:hypothetical protein [Gimesia alba]QDT41108.1 hypothetical protein Pan241w_11670 [Gimesia alba]